MAQTGYPHSTADYELLQSDAADLSRTLVGRSACMVELRALVLKLARSTASVLITGPSGSGKEVVARCLHDFSMRSAQPFVALNCGAVPRELLESELFGHEKGSFTGALANRIGRFEAAHGGTLFLDEIGDMPIDMQVKLLRVLELRSIERVGTTKQIPVNIRLVSATHRDLDAAISRNEFREDLFYRLNIVPLQLPPLADRREDIPDLVAHFQNAGDIPVLFSRQALEAMMQYHWPGNVRELRNAIDRAGALFANSVVTGDAVEQLISLGRRTAMPENNIGMPKPIPLALPEPSPVAQLTDNVVPIRPDITPFGIDPRSIIGHRGCDMRSLLGDLEQALIRTALDSSGQIVANAARLLGLQRTTLIEKMRKYQIEKSLEPEIGRHYSANAM